MPVTIFNSTASTTEQITQPLSKMLGIVLLFNVITVTLCDSSQRYPYVFLLDIGNEEIQDAASEQLRLSMIGGSATLRYPAVGDGDYITHVRVTGVDFGANLMATVIDGGPGHKYAVIAVAGNKDTPYEIVMTFNTLKENPKLNSFNMQAPIVPAQEMNNDEDNSNDETDQDQDFKTKADQYYDKTNNENLQPEYQSNLNEYGRNVYEKNNVDNDVSSEVPIEMKDFEKYYRYNEVPNFAREKYDEDGAANSVRELPENMQLVNEAPKAEPFIFPPNDDYQNDEEKSIGVVDQNLYDKYKELRPHLAEDVQVYSYKPDVDRDNDNVEKPKEIDQMFNDEEIHKTPYSSKDTNNNDYYVDADETSAVAY